MLERFSKIVYQTSDRVIGFGYSFHFVYFIVSVCFSFPFAFLFYVLKFKNPIGLSISISTSFILIILLIYFDRSWLKSYDYTRINKALYAKIYCCLVDFIMILTVIIINIAMILLDDSKVFYFSAMIFICNPSIIQGNIAFREWRN